LDEVDSTNDSSSEVRKRKKAKSDKSQKSDQISNASKDPNQLDLDPSLLVKALQKFHKDREDLAVQQSMLGVGKQKKDKFAV